MTAEKISKKLVLGKVDYDQPGHKTNVAELEWEWDGTRFSMSGAIWDSRHHDYLAGGQCVDTVAAYFPDNQKVQRMLRIWKDWHLNDLTAGTPEQEAELKKHKFPGYPKSHYEWALEVLTEAGLQPHNGYSYGSQWLTRTVPPEIVAEIESW